MGIKNKEVHKLIIQPFQVFSLYLKVAIFFFFAIQYFSSQFLVCISKFFIITIKKTNTNKNKARFAR